MLYITSYSFGKSGIKPSIGIQVSNYIKQKEAIIADDNLFASREWILEAKKFNIKPIIALNFKNKYLLIAKNRAGYRDISKIIYTNQIFKSKDVYIISISNYAVNDDFVDFVGVKPNKEIDLNSNKPTFPIYWVSFYNNKSFEIANAMSCIVKKVKLLDIVKNNAFIDPNYIVEKDWKKYFDKKTIDNYNKVVNLCENDYNFNLKPQAPNFPFIDELHKKLKLNKKYNQDKILEIVAKRGLLKRLNNKLNQKYKNRINYELSTIKKMGFSGYFLLVNDFIDIAIQNQIPVGPGRGSVAGSLVAYAMGITNIDPLKYNLLFERFLNPERVTMPDIDMDFCQANRQKLLGLIINKYGNNKVAQIVTFSRLSAKSSVNDAGRILGLDYLAKEVSSIIDIQTPPPLKECIEQTFKYKFDYFLKKNGEDARDLINLALKIEGFERNTGVHAAGVVISDEPLYNKAPIQVVNSGNLSTNVVAFEGAYLECVDLIKFDFLGLKTLTVIRKISKLIGEDFNINNIPLDDAKSFQIISKGNTQGVFQIESDGMKSLCKELKPSNMEDLIALIALHRPGPMESGMLEDYIKRVKNPDNIKYYDKDFEPYLKPILEPTKGVIVYQEQVMQIVQVIGGFSLGEADIIRRAMGKKDIKYMQEKAEQFAIGAEKKGLNKQKAIELFKLIEKFAGYGFNKSHSAAYALIAYQTAYLKANHTVEFYTGMLQVVEKDIDKVKTILEDAIKNNIKVIPPSINKAQKHHFITNNKEIMLGLLGIKGASVKEVDVLIQKRPEDGYKSLEHMLELSKFAIKNKKDKNGKNIIMPKLGKGTFVALSKVGVFDEFGYSRKVLIDYASDLLSTSKKKRDEVFKTINNLSDAVLSKAERVKYEIELLGFAITNIEIEDSNLENIKNEDNYNIKVSCIEIDKKISKKGKEYGILKLYANFNTIEALCFSQNVLENIENYLNKSQDNIINLNISYKNGTIFVNNVI